MAQQLKKLQIGYGQFPFLSYLNRCGPTSQEEIAQALFFDKGTTARALKRLEEVGYIERRVASNDHRRYEVKITTRGIEAAVQIKEILREWNNALTAGFDEEQKTAVFNMIVKIAENAGARVKKLQGAVLNGGEL